jgi:microtubule-associated protein-like 5
MAIGNVSGEFVATGEYSTLKPAVHVWNSRTLENVNVLVGVHSRGVHLLEFSNDDRFLLTCGLMNPSAILIYDWRAGTVVLSASVMDPTIDVIVLQGKNSAQYIQKMEEVSQVDQLLNRSPELIEGFATLAVNSIDFFLYNPDMNRFNIKTLLMEESYIHCN